MDLENQIISHNFERVAEAHGVGLKKTNEQVVDAVKEKFIEVPPEEAKLWGKEHKPNTYKKAGSLAKDIRQARRKEPMKSC